MSKRYFEDLNSEEKEIVNTHFQECMADKNMECYKRHKDIREFWAEHKEIDYPDWD